jgi:hypothetical protein
MDNKPKKPTEYGDEKCYDKYVVDSTPIMGDGRVETPVQYPRPQADYRHKGLVPQVEDETRETYADDMGVEEEKMKRRVEEDSQGGMY